MSISSTHCIKKLPQSTINQIAAGEVVERPAHLLKELLENSIDAGAKYIEINFAKGGKEIQIKDDGCGIPQNQLPLALSRHATSKISATDDLWKLTSFGFRGEALASVASVSHLSITSSTNKSQHAYTLTSSFGKCDQVFPTHSNPGTSVKVNKLFDNCPARLKFLKSEGAESTQIKKTIKALAMIHPYITFKILQNKQLLYYFPMQNSFYQRVKQVLQDDSLYHTKGQHLHFQCEIVFSRPHNKQRNSQNIWLFVQRRWIQDMKLKMAIIESYRNLLMHGTYPTAVVNLTCNPAEIDVNIHPAKSQVKFREASDAFRAVSRPLRKALEEAPWLKDILSHTQANNQETLSKDPSFQQDRLFHQTTTSLQEPASKAHQSYSSSPPQQSNIQRTFKNSSDSQESSFLEMFPSLVNKPNQTTVTDQSIEDHLKWATLEVLGQCNLTYIVTQSQKSLILVDQHAAHERILFERLMESWNKKQFQVQKNLIPQTFKLEPHLCDELLKYNFNEIGIELEKIGPDTLIISAQPEIISGKNLGQILIDTARQTEEQGGSFALESMVGDLFASMACHSAIRAGQVLSCQEMKSLLEQMDEFKLSSFCPHGRPVFTEIAFSKLDREFGRIV